MTMWKLFQTSLRNKKAPDITGDGWMNVSSLSQSLRDVVVANKELQFTRDLTGTVVLLYFWDYTDPASLQDIPQIRALWEQYEGKGFLIIGIHTPQLELAADPDKVQGAVLRFDLDFPVVNDASYTTWRRYGCKVWPRKILVSAHGVIQYDEDGEGKFDELETLIREQLPKVRETQLFPATNENEQTPKIAFNAEFAHMQGIALSPPMEPAQYHLQFKLPVHHWGLSGWWILQKDHITNGQITDDQACVVHFLGNAVTLSARSSEDCSIEVLIDSKPIPERMRGRDIVEQGGRTYVHIRNDRGYSLALRLPHGKHILSLVPVTGMVFIEECLFS